MENIRLIEKDMIGRICEIFRAGISRMEELNIRQWDEIYPDKAQLEADIESKTMFGFFEGDRLCAVEVLNRTQSPEYSEIKWLFPDRNPLVLHRLCVDPLYQGKGIAKKMVAFAEEYSRKNGFKTIRLDAFVENPISVGLYRVLGYHNSGKVRFRKGDFYCFEKRISGKDPEES